MTTFRYLLRCLPTLLAFAQAEGAVPSLVPLPSKLTMGQGVLTLNQESRILATSKDLEPLAKVLAGEIKQLTGVELKGPEQYAKERGFYLMPELDLPGHSGRLIADAGDISGLPGNGSTINIASPKGTRRPHCADERGHGFVPKHPQYPLGGRRSRPG